MFNFSFIGINHNIIHKRNPTSHFEIINIKKKKSITNNKSLKYMRMEYFYIIN